MKNNALSLTIIAALVVGSISALWFVSSYSKAAEPSSFRSFSVSGEGKVTALPDIATFSFGVITQGGVDLASLQTQNTQKVNAAISFLKEREVKAEDITTKGYYVEPRYQYYNCYQGQTVCPPAEIVGYTVTQNVQVKARDFTILGELLSGVVENGANTVSQLNFSVDDQTQVQNEAREEAINKARAKAETIAKASGFRLGRLLSLNESGGPIPYPIYDYATEAYGRGGATPVPAPTLEPGSQDITVNVTLVYEIK